MSKVQNEFEQEARKKEPSLVRELIAFLANNKKWWLLPILVCLGLLLFLAFFAGSGAAPFIYTIF